MSFKSFFVNKILTGFFISSTLICALMAVLGVLFEPSAQLGYIHYLSPLLYGAATSLPILITYSRKELSVRAALIRNILHFFIIELIVLAIVFVTGDNPGLPVMISVALTVPIVYGAVSFMLWLHDLHTAKDFNKALLRIQQQEPCSSTPDEPG